MGSNNFLLDDLLDENLDINKFMERPESETIIINCQFKLLEKLGSGAFGDIYSGIDMISRTDVAVKVEPADIAFP